MQAAEAVVTWGDADFGGDSSAVRESLHEDVVQVAAIDFAFAAVKAGGSVAAVRTVLRSLLAGLACAFGDFLSPGVLSVNPQRMSGSPLLSLLSYLRRRCCRVYTYITSMILVSLMEIDPACIK